MEEKQTKKVGKRRTQAHRLMPTKHLEQLTKKARALAGEVEPEDVSLSSISQKLARLQQLHSQLQESLISGSEQLVASRLRQEIGDAQAECTSFIDLPEEVFDDKIIIDIFKEFPWRRERDISGQLVESPRTMYSIENKFVCGLKEGHIGVQFDTFYAGERVESFYLTLAGESAFESLSVRMHTIPFFVPFKEAATAYLSSSASMFINATSNLLQAYISRREQIKKLKEFKGDRIKLISHTVLCDALDFLMEESDCKVLVKLRYEDTHSDLPTETKVVVWPPPPFKKQHPVFLSRERKPKATPISLSFAEAILQQELLPEAYEKLVRGLDAVLAGRSVEYPETGAPPSGDF